MEGGRGSRNWKDEEQVSRKKWERGERGGRGRHDGMQRDKQRNQEGEGEICLEMDEGK